MIRLLGSLYDRFFRKLARRVPGYESSEYYADRMSGEWTKESIPELDDASYAQRLEEEEGNKGPGTPKLPVKSTGVLQETKGSGHLDYSLKEHFFSPLNPTNQ